VQLRARQVRIDPFADDPILLTGSYNLEPKVIEAGFAIAPKLMTLG